MYNNVATFGNCADNDRDGADDRLERYWGTDSTKKDTDGDGLDDKLEIYSVNGDSALTFLDANIVSKAASLVAPFNTGALSPLEKKAYDINRDGIVTFLDAQFVSKAAAGYGACG